MSPNSCDKSFCVAAERVKLCALEVTERIDNLCMFICLCSGHNCTERERVEGMIETETWTRPEQFASALFTRPSPFYICSCA